MKKILSLIFAFTLLLCGCSNVKSDSGKLNIVATNFSCYDFARAVAGDSADITLLIPPGADIHSFEPTALDIAKIKDSDLFIYVGGESDAWVEKILENLKKEDAAVLNLFDELGLEHNHETDEHIWTSPENAIKIVNLIRDNLNNINSDNSKKYITNAQQYVSEIKNVEDTTKEIIAAAEHKHLVIADRFPLKYFAEYYGLNVTAAFSACDHETDIPLNTAASLIETVKINNLAYIFVTESGNRDLAKIISDNTGCEILTLQSIQSISAKDLENGVTYVSLMEQNANVLRKGLTLCQ